MRDEMNEQDFIYDQGIANLKLEGMDLDDQQDQIARKYISGEISRHQLIQEALQYARSQ